MNSSILNLLSRSKDHQPVLLGLALLAGLWADAQRLALAGTASLGNAGVADASQMTGLADRSGWEWLFEPSAWFRSEPEESLTLPLPDVPKSVMQRPLVFERNEGQTAEEVAFLSRGQGYTLFLTKHEAVMMLQTAATSEGAERLGLRQPSAAFAPHAADGKAPEDWRTPKPDGDAVAREESDSSRILRMRLSGSNPNPAVFGHQPQRAKVNYFIGNDASRWRTNIPTFGRVHCANVYEGIDLLYYGNEGRLEYDFVVAPGADPNQIALEFDGAQGLEVAANGDLVLDVGGRELRWQKPLIYQEINGARIEIAGQYRIRQSLGDHSDLVQKAPSTASTKDVSSVQFVSFELAAYDPRQPLVIDPILVYATYLGGAASDSARAVAVDKEGNAFVAGITASLDFPMKSPRFGVMAGGDLDVFVAKFNPGGELLFSTYLGGTGTDGKLEALKVAVSPKGECFVVGTTDSMDFPVVEPLQNAYGGGGNDAFVTALASDGSELVFSTYLGGSDFDQGRSLAFGANGDLYVTGATHSYDFPVTQNAFQRELSALADGASSQRDAFLVRLAPDASNVVYSTFYGRSSTIDTGWDVTVDADDNVYFTAMAACYVGDCSEVVLVKLNADGSQRLFEKQVRAGAGTGTIVSFPYLALGHNGRVVLACTTNYRSLPARIRPPSSSPGYSDAYIASFNATSGAFVTAVYLGGTGNDDPNSISVDSNGELVIVGLTAGPGGEPSGFPVTNPFGSLLPGCSGDIFVTRLRPDDLEVTFSTVLGGSQHEYPGRAALSKDGHVFIPGMTRGDFPVANAYQPTVAGEEDAFLVKLSLRDARVQITRSGQDVTLSWPVEASDYVLEAASSLPAVTWNVVTNTPTINETEHSVQLPITGSARFFRLRRP